MAISSIDDEDSKMQTLKRLLSSNVTDEQIAASPPMSRERLKLVFISLRPTLIICSGLTALMTLVKFADRLWFS